MFANKSGHSESSRSLAASKPAVNDAFSSFVRYKYDLLSRKLVVVQIT